MAKISQIRKQVAVAIVGALGFFATTTSLDAGSHTVPGTLVITEELKFQNICDGSAAVLLDPRTVLVAYDENNTLYAFDTGGGKPVARFDLENLLELPSDREMDIEAAVREKDQIWWIGSHGLNKKGKDRPNRRVLFSTVFPDRNLENLDIVRQPVDLTGALLANPKVAEILNQDVLMRPPKRGGISIEGLALHPEAGLIVSFRSPLTGPGGQTGNAFAVHMVESGNGFMVKKIYELDLNNRGIRDMIKIGKDYVLIAGAAGKGGKAQLYSWQESSGRLTRLSVSFDGLNPEALVRLDQRWLVLSDDGKQKRPDASARDGDRKCDKIRKKSGENHQSVYFKGIIMAPGTQ